MLPRSTSVRRRDDRVVADEPEVVITRRLSMDEHPGLSESSLLAVEDTAISHSDPLPKKAAFYLYVSHFLSTWNSRLFEMGAILFIAAIYPGTLLPVSIYALTRNAAAVLLSSLIGMIIDTSNRLNVIRASIVGQRLAVAASCALFLTLCYLDSISTPLKTGLFAVTVFLACVEKLSAVMNLVAIERDWIVEMTHGRPVERQLLNARMRRIDLFCKLLGPLAVSLVDGASTTVAMWLTMSLSVGSVAVEYLTITRVYTMIPALRRTGTSSGSDMAGNPSAATNTNSMQAIIQQAIFRIIPVRSFSIYIHHPAFLPSFSLALLYFTVLSFSGQMVAFLLASGYSSTNVGIARAVSTIFELFATWTASHLQKRVGPVRGGIWSINWEILFLAGGLAWFVAVGQSQGYQNVTAASGLVAGVILSRVGLWSFDLCAQIIIQDEVEENYRGAFSTVEAALQNLFELLSYAPTIIFARPDQFLWPAVISTTAVGVAGGLYTEFVRRRRGHLLHRPVCLKGLPEHAG